MKEIKKRVGLNGEKLILNQDKIKYSELFKSFVHPLIGKNDQIGIIKTKYTFGATVWNAATMRELSEEAFLLSKKELVSMIPGIPEVELLFDDMVKRKQEEFSDYKNLIVDFEIKKISGLDYDLTVVTTPLKNK